MSGGPLQLAHASRDQHTRVRLPELKRSAELEQQPERRPQGIEPHVQKLCLLKRIIFGEWVHLRPGGVVAPPPVRHKQALNRDHGSGMCQSGSEG